MPRFLEQTQIEKCEPGIFLFSMNDLLKKSKNFPNFENGLV